MAHQYPGQVQCIFLRNTTATDPGDRFPYDTSGFKGLNQSQYMFFLNADDLTNLDISNGNCYNSSIKQNVTFSYQGLPFGLSKSSDALRDLNLGGSRWTMAGSALLAVAGMFVFGGL